jgi:AcrR family transcriptional regulator
MARSPTGGRNDAASNNRKRIIDALMALLARKRLEEIGFGDIAARAGLGLADCRAAFSSVLEVLATQMAVTDRLVLRGGEDMREEPPRERLFDVLMRRLETLEPHKAAVRSLARSAMCDPPLAIALNGLTVRSMQWMLTAAGIDSSGPRGLLRAQGLALLYASVVRTWLEDDEEGLPRTMAALDRALAKGARWSVFLDDICRCVPRRCCPPMPWRRRARDRGDEDVVAA